MDLMGAKKTCQNPSCLFSRQPISQGAPVRKIWKYEVKTIQDDIPRAIVLCFRVSSCAGAFGQDRKSSPTVHHFVLPTLNKTQIDTKSTSKLWSLATYFLTVEPEIISKGMTVLNFQNPDVRARNPRKFAGGWRQRRGEGEPGGEGGTKFGERRAGGEDSGSVQKRHGKPTATANHRVLTK